MTSVLEVDAARDTSASQPFEAPTRSKPVRFNAKARYDLSGPVASYALKDCPFETIIVDVTHRCNMGCRNCYIPNRDVPDLDAAWLKAQLEQLPRRRFLRLVGAEPTMRDDLPELVAMVKAAGHHPMVLSNGLRLVDAGLVRALKQAGLSMIHLSLNGVFDDRLYKAIDGMRCAKEKRQALDNLCAENIMTAIGMIVVRDLSESALGDFWQTGLASRAIREVHVRSIGQHGRYMKSEPFLLDELQALFAARTGVDMQEVKKRVRTDSSIDFQTHGKRVQLTQWPDLGSTTRGRLTPEGRVAPFFEHMIENEGGY
jgi:molybdenum cofactor biosynthesis enzyme MoaA